MNSGVAWALVFHLIGFVFWMAGLLMATQALAAQAEETAPEARAALARYEMKLITGFVYPGAAITVVAGAAVLWLQPDYLHQGWLHAKLFLVVLLLGLNVKVHWRAKAFAAGRVELKKRDGKMLHGIASLLFLLIVILVMIKPF